MHSHDLPRVVHRLLLGACCLIVGLTAACRHPARSTVAPADSVALKAAPPAPASLRLPRDAFRFEIETVDDSTARFKPREVDWIREGMVAYVVDPLHRDALVARLRVTEVHAVMVTALVTSQVTRVTPDHVVLLMEPSTRWWATRRFWLGVFSGGVLGGAIGAVSAR